MNAKHSRDVLDLYCRKDQYVISESLSKNETGSPLAQVIPIKKRCGSLNPYRMHPNDKCYCEQDVEISGDGSSMLGKSLLSYYIIYNLAKYYINQSFSLPCLMNKFIWNIKIVGGIWINVEILNIPWNDNFLDPESNEFKAAKNLIETEVYWMKTSKYICKIITFGKKKSIYWFNSYF